MVRRIKELESNEIGTTAGSFGRVQEFYFDDRAWVIRYLLVDAGTWLSSEEVLISFRSIRRAIWEQKVLRTSPGAEQGGQSAGLPGEKLVSRAKAIQYLGYYGYRYYCDEDKLWGASDYPGMLITGVGYGESDREYRRLQAAQARDAFRSARERSEDPHLRSARSVMGYHVRASDGEIGYIQDLLVDEDTWAVRYIVVDTGDWWPGHQVLVSPQWIQEIDWADEGVLVDLTRSAVKLAPPFASTDELSRRREARLFAHYGRIGYWEQEAQRVLVTAEQ